MSTRDTRRADQKDWAAGQADGRRDYAPRVIAAHELCPARLGRHNFSDRRVDDPRGSGLVVFRCWYCTQYSPRSLERIAAWRAAQATEGTP